MLVLSRRVGESLVIGDEITITVLEQRGDVVRIGVAAPRHIQVRRQELLTEVAETNRAAASPTAGAIAGLSALVSGAAAGTPRPVSSPADRPVTPPATSAGTPPTTSAGTPAPTRSAAQPADARPKPAPRPAPPAAPRPAPPPPRTPSPPSD